MLKLKYLFPNFALAEIVVKNWEYEDLELFKYWRISSNAIYPFKNKNGVCYLRMAPCQEKTEEAVLAELEFLNYLKNKGYSAIQAVPSREGRELETVNTPWGTYYASVFKRVKGEALAELEISDNIAGDYGKALGRLHKLSKSYEPAGVKRLGWREQLQWVRKVVSVFGGHIGALKEADLLEEFFDKLSVTEENYGLIHYDFELDNVFYDGESNEISPIDFDDCMYH